MNEQQVYRDEDFANEDGTVHGLRCFDCGAAFIEGQPISERLDSFMGDTPVVQLVCVGCAMGGEHG